MSNIPATFLNYVESDKPLLAAVARMYAAALVDASVCRNAVGWRDQLRYLLRKQGRAQVIDELMDMVDGLTIRRAVTLVNMVEKTPSEVLPAVGADA